MPKGPQGRKRFRADAQELRMSPAMAAGIETRLWSMEDVAAMLDEHAQRNAPKLADRLVG